MRVKHDLIGCLYMFSVTWSIAIARLFFHRDARCLFEVGISMDGHVCARRFTRPCIAHTEF